MDQHQLFSTGMEALRLVLGRGMPQLLALVGWKGAVCTLKPISVVGK